MTGAAEQSTQGTAVKDYSTMTPGALVTHANQLWGKIKQQIPTSSIDTDYVREFDDLLNRLNEKV